MRKDKCQYKYTESCNNNGYEESDGSCICNQGYLGDKCQYTAITNSNIKTAVNLWISAKTIAQDKYGVISSWDVSGVTKMSQLSQNWINTKN